MYENLMSQEVGNEPGSQKKLVNDQQTEYSLVVSAMEIYSRLDEERKISNVEITVEIPKISNGEEPLKRTWIVEVLRDSPELSGRINCGLQIIAGKLEQNENFRHAFYFILQQVYMAARKKGIVLAAEHLSEAVNELS